MLKRSVNKTHVCDMLAKPRKLRNDWLHNIIIKNEQTIGAMTGLIKACQFLILGNVVEGKVVCLVYKAFEVGIHHKKIT